MFYSLPLIGRAAMRLENVDSSSEAQATQARRRNSDTTAEVIRDHGSLPFGEVDESPSRHTSIL